MSKCLQFILMCEDVAQCGWCLIVGQGSSRPVRCESNGGVGSEMKTMGEWLRQRQCGVTLGD